MNKPEQNVGRVQAKRVAVFDAAAEVFARYGFRRTTMNDIAQAAGISRPALYLMFENKENLFQDLVIHRLNLAIEQALAVLAGEENFQERFVEALLVFEKIFYEPIADSPHGAELMDLSQSLASDVMMKGISRFLGAMADALIQAENDGHVSFNNSALKPQAFVELLFTTFGGIKKKASTTAEFRKQVKQTTEIFLNSIQNRGH